MALSCDYNKIAYLRKTIRDRRTRIVKDKNGDQKGGVILTDETIQPYERELAALEAKMAEDKEKMKTGERVDAAAEDVKADAEQNKEDLMALINDKFEKLAPNKFKQDINKWAYIDAKGNSDYYKRPDGKVYPRTGDIPPECTFIHKVRVQGCIEKELDLYKFFHEDGTAGHATGLGSFTFISQVGMKVILKRCALPTQLENFAGVAGTIMNEPPAKKPPRDTDKFDISFPAPSGKGTKKSNGTVTRKVSREFLEFQVVEPIPAKKARDATSIGRLGGATCDESTRAPSSIPSQDTPEAADDSDSSSDEAMPPPVSQDTLEAADDSDSSSDEDMPMPPPVAAPSAPKADTTRKLEERGVVEWKRGVAGSQKFNLQSRTGILKDLRNELRECKTEQQLTNAAARKNRDFDKSGWQIYSVIGETRPDGAFAFVIGSAGTEVILGTVWLLKPGAEMPKNVERIG